MTSENERRLILEMIESGKISASEGLRLLQAISGEDEPDLEEAAGSYALPPDSAPAEAGESPPPPPGNPEGDEIPADQERVYVGETLKSSLPPDIEKWRRWWMIPMWVGVGITVVGGLLMYWALQASGIGFWFLCAWVPFLIGLLAIVVAWQSRTARWLHLRVYQKPGEWPQKIAISFPLPIRLTSWFLRTFRGRIPGLEGTSVDELILALGSATTPENPLFIEVEEGEDGERVQVFIG